MTPTQLETPPASPATVRFRARLTADTRYVLIGFPVALAAFVVCLTLVTLGAGLAVLAVGVPLMVAAMMQARALARSERARVAPVLGAPITEAGYREARTPDLPGRVRAVLTDPQSRRDLAHAILRIVPSTIGFSFVVTWWAGVLGGLSWSLWGWALPGGPDDKNLPQMLGLGDAYLISAAFYLVAGLLLAVTLPAVTRGAARLEARFARALLTPAARA